LRFIETIAKETPPGASTDASQGGNGSVPGEGSSGTLMVPAVLVNVALEGMALVMTREGGGGGGGSSGVVMGDRWFGHRRGGDGEGMPFASY
jgi:hypothetical protein